VCVYVWGLAPGSSFHHIMLITLTTTVNTVYYDKLFYIQLIHSPSLLYL
jgi:hypothetical protein